MSALKHFTLDGFEVRVRTDDAPATLAAELAPIVAKAARAQRVLAERTELAGVSLWLKGDHLPGKARWRHSLAGWIGRVTPREREFERLRWLRARLFRAPQPIACGAALAGGVLRYQLLAMAELGPHEPLSTAFEHATQFERAAWIDELARETARLHALHLAHRNLFLRNVLVDRAPPPTKGDPRRLMLIDPWRAGAQLPRRGVDYDLGALMLDAASLWSFDEQRAFFERYFEQRRVQDRPAKPKSLLTAAAQRRIELARRARREVGAWSFDSLLSAIELSRQHALE